jgi:hypothetical protein
MIYALCFFGEGWGGGRGYDSVTVLEERYGAGVLCQTFSPSGENVLWAERSGF